MTFLTVLPLTQVIVDFLLAASAFAFASASALVFAAISLMRTIEAAFNDIWGIRLGRSLLMRIVFYWTILTLGAVLFFASVAMLGAGAAEVIGIDEAQVDALFLGLGPQCMRPARRGWWPRMLRSGCSPASRSGCCAPSHGTATPEPPCATASLRLDRAVPRWRRTPG